MADMEELAKAIKNLTVKKEKPYIPVFAGRDTKKGGTPFDDWLYCVNKAKGFTSESELSNVIFQSLVGEARSRFIRLDSSDFSSILKHFKDSYADKTSLYDRLQSFHSLKQNSKESIQCFADRFESVIHWIHQCEEGSSSYCKDDSIQKKAFVKGLIDKNISDHLQYIIDDPSKNMKDVLCKALYYETSSIVPVEKPVKSVKQEDVLSKLDARLSSIEKKLEEKQAKFVPFCKICKTKGHNTFKCTKKANKPKNDQGNSLQH